MPLFARKKAVQVARPKEDLKIMVTKVESSNIPTAALSIMSIEYDDRQGRSSTYQQPSTSSALKPTQPENAYSQPYPQGLALAETLDKPPKSLKELRGLHSTENGFLRRPVTAPGERRGSTGTARPATTSRRPSSASSAAKPQVGLDPAPSSYYSTLPTRNSQPSLHNSNDSYIRSHKYRRSGSMSSQSSYAASEASDLLYNSASAGRSSSGGTAATTPGSTSDREKERNLSLKKAPSTVIRPEVLSGETTLNHTPSTTPTNEAKRPLLQARPSSEMSVASMSQGSKNDSPVLSQTSSMSRKTSSRYTLTDFNFIRTLGTGSFGRVHLVRSCHNTRFYAIKVLNKDRVVRMKQVEHTNSEREMLERVRHPFLVNLWGTFKDSKNLYMVMDFVSGGELFSLLRKSQVRLLSLALYLCSQKSLQRFPDPVAKFFAAEVALALDYLHSLDIIYRDLKPENILLAADGHVKVTDFGFAKYVPDITWTLCGTPDYLAPEVVQSKGYNKSVDWYALGVLIFEMLVSQSLDLGGHTLINDT